MLNFVVATNKFADYPVVQLADFSFKTRYQASICAEMMKIQDPDHDYFVISSSHEEELKPAEIRAKLTQIFSGSVH